MTNKQARSAKDCLRRRSRGQTLTMAALLMPVLIGFGALATDVALYYVNWFAMQKGVDSAVLSGAAYLPDQTSQAISAADNYAEANDIQAGEITSVTVGSGNDSLSMTARRTVPFYFARLLGVPTGTVQVHATATIVTVGGAIGVVPLGIDSGTPYTMGDPITLHPGMTGPGNWTALILGSDPGTSAYVNNLEYGYSGDITVGQMLLTQTGSDNHNTEMALNFRLGQGHQVDPSGTATTHSLDDPRVMLVPMVNFAGINGQSQVPLNGLAEVWLNSVNSDGTISTTFIQQAAPQSQPDPSAQNFGSYVPILTQ